MSVSMSDHDRDCPCFEDRFGKCNCKAQLIADFVAEIAQLRAALDESVAREAIIRDAMAKYRCMVRSNGPRELQFQYGETVDAILTNPIDAAKSLLRDRERLEWITAHPEIELRQIGNVAGWAEHRIGKWILSPVQGFFDSYREAIDAAMTNQPAIPDVVAEATRPGEGSGRVG